MATPVIRLGGTDITSSVEVRTARFTAAVNGVAGIAEIRIKDLFGTFTPSAGQTLTLDVDGRRMWSGWVTMIRRSYWFPVEDTMRNPCDPGGIPRGIVLQGVDKNILFRKRIIYDRAHPTNVQLGDPDQYGQENTAYAPDTPDTTMIADLFDHYLNIEGIDGIDTTSGVTYTGSANPDYPGNPYAAGWQFGDGMKAISMMTGAIWYIDPEDVFVYADVDRASNSRVLSDTPTGDDVGYREMGLFFHGADLVNDAIAWGAGQGLDQVVYYRATDADSIATHGRWQIGDFRTDIYKQVSIERRARSFVYGSPENKRGAKDDAVMIECAVFEPAFRCGERVRFVSDVFGYDDVIPIRKMTITFPTPEIARFDLGLAHEIDPPWSIYERPPWPKLGGPDTTTDPPPDCDENCIDGPLIYQKRLFGWRYDRTGAAEAGPCTISNYGVVSFFQNESWFTGPPYELVAGYNEPNFVIPDYETNFLQGKVELLVCFEWQYNAAHGTSHGANDAIRFQSVGRQGNSDWPMAPGDNNAWLYFTGNGRILARDPYYGDAELGHYDQTVRNYARIVRTLDQVRAKVWPVTAQEPSAWTAEMSIGYAMKPGVGIGIWYAVGSGTHDYAQIFSLDGWQEDSTTAEVIASQGIDEDFRGGPYEPTMSKLTHSVTAPAPGDLGNFGNPYIGWTNATQVETVGTGNGGPSAGILVHASQWDQNLGTNLLQHLSQEISTFTIGNSGGQRPRRLRITGRIAVPPGQDQQLFPTWSLAFWQYGVTSFPYLGMQWLVGHAIGNVVVPTAGYVYNNGYWSGGTPFTLEVTVNEDLVRNLGTTTSGYPPITYDRFQWGVTFSAAPQAFPGSVWFRSSVFHAYPDGWVQTSIRDLSVAMIYTPTPELTWDGGGCEPCPEPDTRYCVDRPISLVEISEPGGASFYRQTITIAAYAPGSVSAQVEGMTLRPGIDILETDPTTGLVMVVSTSPLTGVITICYLKAVDLTYCEQQALSLVAFDEPGSPRIYRQSFTLGSAARTGTVTASVSGVTDYTLVETSPTTVLYSTYTNASASTITLCYERV